jgi:hypothetical protein
MKTGNHLNSQIGREVAATGRMKPRPLPDYAVEARKTATAAAEYFEAADDIEFIDNLTRDIVRNVETALASSK